MNDGSLAQWRPAPWFLLTPPLPKPGTLSRPRIGLLLDGLVDDAAIALVQAPSGFGKSTALAEWAGQRAQPVVWLTATRRDESARQFAISLLSAFCRAAERHDELSAFTEVVATPDDLILMLSRLLSALDAVATSVTVVIDDAHLLSADVVDQVLAPLAEHGAMRLNIVLAGTQALDQWFGAALASGLARRIDSGQLALTVDEIRALPGARSRDDGPDAAEKLHGSTQGWPVAVRLALSAGPGGSRADLTDGHEAMTAYVSQVVLAALPAELAAFVVDVSVSSRVTAELAEMLTGRADSGALLEECVRRGLFLDRFEGDDEGAVYRWHDVFSGHCRRLLARADEPRYRRLNGALAETLAIEFPAKASVHAMRANDPELASRILREGWLRLLVEGDAALLNARCLALPTADDDPSLLLIRASCLSMLDDREGASMLSARARAMADAAGEGTDRGAQFVDAFSGLFLAHDHAQLASAADAVARVLHGSAPSGYLGTHAQFLLGWTELRLRRNPAAAVRLLLAARRDALAVGADLLARRATLNLMFALTLGGRFTAVRSLSAELDAAVANGDCWQHYDGGIEFVSRGMTAYWQNDLDEAARQQRALIAMGGGAASYTALA
ncbi:MAG: AAA family ATPase, partial [Actinobacteria bacterium]|nr:AAA family ATPase [Actinomycetota bacterium]